MEVNKEMEGQGSRLATHLQEFRSNPRSHVFAPLAEYYREKGMLRQALAICEDGLKYRPSFTRGILAYAHCLFDLKRYADCLRETEKLLEENWENIGAQRLQASVFIKLRQYKAAKTSLQQILYLVPQDSKSLRLLEKIQQAQDGAENSFSPSPRPLVEDGPGELGDFVPLLSPKNSQKNSQKMDLSGSTPISPKSAVKNKDTTFATRTVAELYLRQGLTDRANKILHLMLQKNPKDAWAKERLLELDFSEEEPTKRENSQGAREELMVKAQYLDRLLQEVRRN